MKGIEKTSITKFEFLRMTKNPEDAYSYLLREELRGFKYHQIHKNAPGKEFTTSTVLLDEDHFTDGIERAIQMRCDYNGNYTYMLMEVKETV